MKSSKCDILCPTSTKISFLTGIVFLGQQNTRNTQATDENSRFYDSSRAKRKNSEKKIRTQKMLGKLG